MPGRASALELGGGSIMAEKEQTQIYRNGKLGSSLVDALDTLIKEGKLSGELALKVLAEVGFCSPLFI